MVSDTIERIRAHLAQTGNTKKDLAEAARVHPNTLQGIEDPKWNPSARVLLALEAQLPINPAAEDLAA